MLLSGVTKTDKAEDRCRLIFSPIFCGKVYKGKELRRKEMMRIFFSSFPFRFSPSWCSLSFFYRYSTLFFFQSSVTTSLDVTCCVCLYTLLHVVAQNLKPVKLKQRSWTGSTSATEVKPIIRDIIIRKSNILNLWMPRYTQRVNKTD